MEVARGGGFKEGKDKFPLLGTQLLLNGLKRAQELNDGQGNLKEALPEHLMASQGLNLKRCLRSLRKFMSALDHEHIVLVADITCDPPAEGCTMQYMDVVEHKVTRCSLKNAHCAQQVGAAGT